MLNGFNFWVNNMSWNQVESKLPSSDGYVLAKNKAGQTAKVLFRKRFDGLIWKAFFGSSNELHYVTEWAEVE